MTWFPSAVILCGDRTTLNFGHHLQSNGEVAMGYAPGSIARAKNLGNRQKSLAVEVPQFFRSWRGDPAPSADFT